MWRYLWRMSEFHSRCFALLFVDDVMLMECFVQCDGEGVRSYLVIKQGRGEPGCDLHVSERMACAH